MGEYGTEKLKANFKNTPKRQNIHKKAKNIEKILLVLYDGRTKQKRRVLYEISKIKRHGLRCCDCINGLVFGAGGIC